MIPTVKEYMDKAMNSITYGDTVYGEYKCILQFIDDYCTLLIDQCADSAETKTNKDPYYDNWVEIVDKESILKVKERL